MRNRRRLHHRILGAVQSLTGDMEGLRFFVYSRKKFEKIKYKRKKIMKRCILKCKETLATITLLLSPLAAVNTYAETSIVIPDYWRTGDTNTLNFLAGQLQYGTPLTGNVCVPPYYYRLTENNSGRDIAIVKSIIGSSHDGTWVQAPRRTRASSWYYDGPFLNAKIDTLRLPHTITEIGRGAFENGTMNVLICGASTPPTFENPNNYNYPAYNAKLIVPTGSNEAYSCHSAWGKFSVIEEGAEIYYPAQMVNEEENWYELRNGQAMLVCGGGVIAENITLSNVSYPVTALGMAAIDPYSQSFVTLNAHINDFRPYYHLATSDSYFQQSYSKYKIRLSNIDVSPDNNTYASYDGVLYTKDYHELCYFSRSAGNNRRLHIMPIGCERISENGIPESGYTSEMGFATIICPKPVSEMCSGSVGCSTITPKHNDYPVVIDDNILALWSVEGQCFDLHKYKTDEKGVIIPGKLTVYGITQPVKTIGKYKLYLSGQAYDFDVFEQMGFQRGYVRNTDSRSIFPPLQQAQTAVIEDGVEEIYYVFYEAANLKSVTLPKTLKIIGDNCFNGCKNLNMVVAPAQLEQIEVQTFWNCLELKDFYCLGNTPPLVLRKGEDSASANHTFANLFGNNLSPLACTLHVPTGTMQAYKNAPVWKEFGNIVEDANTGISSTTCTSIEPIDYFAVDGVKTSKRHGLNIVRYSNGIVKKVIIK